MKVVLLSLLGATAFAAAASAAPMNPTTLGEQASNVDQVRLVCNERGRCWQSRRYVRPYYGDDGYYARRSYNYYGSPGYYGGGYGGPSIGFSFGGSRW